MKKSVLKLVLVLITIFGSLTAKAQFHFALCADDSADIVLYFDRNILSPNMLEGGDNQPLKYEVDFNPIAVPEDCDNFRDTTNNFTDKRTIEIPFPKKAYPDYYTATITLTNTYNNCEITYSLILVIFYPSSIMTQKFNDIIAVQNRYYNGGYDIEGYQWYHNNEIMVGEQGSYIYTKNGTLKIGDEYYVNITRIDGSTMFSCPLVVGEPKQTVSTYPTVVTEGGSITIYVNGNEVTRWTTTGILP
jgi:hypothetical protein